MSKLNSILTIAEKNPSAEILAVFHDVLLEEGFSFELVEIIKLVIKNHEDRQEALNKIRAWDNNLPKRKTPPRVHYDGARLERPLVHTPLQGVYMSYIWSACNIESSLCIPPESLHITEIVEDVTCKTCLRCIEAFKQRKNKKGE